MPRRLRHVLVWFAVTAATLTPVATAGIIVSVNPHTQSLPSGTPPMPDVANIACVAANAYHVSSATEVSRALGYPNNGKPKILSDDASGVTPADAKSWIDSACAAGEHYEHYDGAIGSNATTGVIINSAEEFPSKNVLNHIKNSNCVSDLTPFGTLGRSGTEFTWNGVPVTLVGHSWMGAVAGLNFDIAGYLGVLDFYRVNLTRIWVIEQWTGLSVDAAGAPVYANSILPFTGSLASGTVNLTAFNTDYLDRLEEFVDEAWGRGIVVQVTLFDRHGLLNKPGQWGRWLGSPYSVDNNQDPVFTAGPTDKAPTNFVDLCQPTYTQAPTTCTIQSRHFNFIKAIRNRLKNKGNVIFEIMNEPLDGEWGAAKNTAFHRWAADATLREGTVKVDYGCYR